MNSQLKAYSDIILFAVRGARPGKNVQLTESEIRGLCLKSREIFLSQPILLELEAPLKICGMYIHPWLCEFLCHRIVWLLPLRNCVCVRLSVICKCFRWHSWPVLWFTTALWIWRIPSWVQLFVSWRLCGQRKAIAWDNLPSACIQDKISREFLFAQG